MAVKTKTEPSYSDQLKRLGDDRLLDDALARRKSGDYAGAAQIGQQLLKSDQRNPRILHFLAQLAWDTGADDIASGMLTRALALAPKSPSILVDYGNAMHGDGRYAEALTAFKKALALNPRSGTAYMGLGDTLLDTGKPEDALIHYRRALALEPGHRRAAHMVQMLGGKLPAQAPQDYVPELFDNYAGFFDTHLQNRLGYCVPQLIAETLARRAPPGGTVLDIGCGTGLVAEALAGSSATIDGIDLSHAMVEAAAAKGLYRTLATGDAIEVLDTDPAFAGPYHLAIAADVVIYMGDLAPILAAIKKHLVPDGLLVFSIETGKTDSFAILSSGRFCHDIGYVKNTATETGYTVLEATPAILRTERKRPIEGHIVVLKVG